MSTEIQLEALVAHVYVVGGRAVGSPPPGALVMLAPKRAPRPRQEETFFALLIPNGAVKAQAQVYEALAQQAAETYFKTTGGITGGVREMLTKLNQHLLEQQQTLQQPLRASFICAIMRDEEIYLGRCGPMLAVFRDETSLQSFPKERSRENLNLAPPLGATMEPRLELARYDLKAGCMLVLADESFLTATDQQWQEALVSKDIEAVLEPVRLLVNSPLGHATVIQFVTEDTPTPEPARLSERPPLLTVPPPPSDPIAIPSPEPVRETETPPEPLEEAHPAEDEPVEEVILTLEDQPTEKKKRTTGVMKAVAKTLFGVAETTSKVGEKIFPEAQPTEPPEAKYPFLSNLLFLLAFIIPMIIIVVVVGLALSPTGQTEFEQCRADVLELREAARLLTPTEGGSLDDAKAQEARAQWEVVKAEALACEVEKPGDEEMLFTAGEAQNNLDRFDRATRRNLQPLRRFRDGADLRGPISGNWITLYTLDRANDEVYQDVLSTDGSTLVEVSDAPMIFKGQSIGIEVVNDLVDIVWLERGGLPAGNNNVPIALDETGLLIWRNEGFEENESLRLVTPTTWGKPVAITMWRLNLYVLDPVAQQIWRFVPNQGVYGDVPEEYFVGLGEVRPDLSQAIDFGIDEDGNLYVLFQNGDIKKFRGGEEQPFDLYNIPQGALKSGTSLYVDNNPISRGMVITDTASQTVYTLSLGGTVNIGYRPLNLLNAFERLSGVLVNADTNSIYVLSGNFLYHMPRQQQ